MAQLILCCGEGTASDLAPGTVGVDALIEFRNQYITPHVKDYFKEHWGSEMDVSELSVGMWAVCNTGSEGLEMHNHEWGLLTTVYYPLDSDSCIVMADPRHNANRGYPADIANGHFAKLRIAPKAGDLLLFPSFVYHQVSPGKPGMRIALVNNFGI